MKAETSTTTGICFILATINLIPTVTGAGGGPCTRFDGVVGNSITLEIYEVPGTDTISSPSVVSNPKRYRELIPLYGFLNSEITLSLAGDKLTDIFGFRVLNTGVYLQLEKVLDRDSTSLQNGIITDFDPIDDLQYTLTCTVVANSSDTTYDLTVKILDLNDHAPQFIELDTEDEIECSGNISVTVNHYHRQHVETLPVGNLVAQVKAYDYDSPESSNSRISYRITGVSPPSLSDYFIICQETGDIILKTPFSNDTSDTPQYNISVQARDGGEPPMSKTVQVLVGVVRNSYSPQFTQSEISSNLTELGVAGAIVAEPTATDEDNSTTFNQVRYKIDGSAKALQYFEVEPLTGEVRLKESVEADTDTTYIVKVIAYDSEDSEGQPGTSVSRSATATVTINVERNRNPPLLQGLYNDITIKNTDFPGTIVTTISAADADGNAITFDIPDSSEAFDYFYIHPRTGELRLISSVSDKTGHTFQVQIIITDDGIPSRSSDSSIPVQVVQSDVDACGIVFRYRVIDSLKAS